MTFTGLSEGSKSKRKGLDIGKSVLQLQQSGSETVKRLLTASTLAEFDARASKVKGKEKSGFFRTPTYQRIRKTLAAYTSKQQSKPEKWRSTTVATLDKLIGDFTSKRENIAGQRTSDGKARWNAVWYLRPKVKAELTSLLTGGGVVGGVETVGTEQGEEAKTTDEPEVGETPAPEEMVAEPEDVAEEAPIAQEEAEEVAEQVGEQAPEAEAAEKGEEPPVEDVVSEALVEYGPEEEPVQYGPEEEPVQYGPQTQLEAKWDQDPTDFTPVRQHAKGYKNDAPFWEDENFAWSEEGGEKSSVSSQTNSSMSITKKTTESSPRLTMTERTAKRVKQRKLTSSQHSGDESLAEARRQRVLFVQMRRARVFSSQFSDKDDSLLSGARRRRTAMFKEAGKQITEARAAKRATEKGQAERDRLRQKYGNLESWGDLDPIERQKRQTLWDIAHEDTKEAKEFKWALVKERGEDYRNEFTEGAGHLQIFYNELAFAGKRQKEDGSWEWMSLTEKGAVPLTTNEERAAYGVKNTGGHWTLPFLNKYWDKLTNLAAKGAWPKTPPKKETEKKSILDEISQNPTDSSQKTDSSNKTDSSKKSNSSKKSDSKKSDSKESDSKKSDSAEAPEDAQKSDERVRVEQVTKEEPANYRLDFSGGRITQGKSQEILDTGKMATNKAGPGFGIYVMSAAGLIYVGSHQAGLFHHSSFLSGSDVAAAGEMKVVGGKLDTLTNKSGHYLPTEAHLMQAIFELRSHGVKPSTYNVKIHYPDESVKDGLTAAEFLEEQKGTLPKQNRERSRHIKT